MEESDGQVESLTYWWHGMKNQRIAKVIKAILLGPVADFVAIHLISQVIYLKVSCGVLL